jgi:hypothetical protein
VVDGGTSLSASPSYIPYDRKTDQLSWVFVRLAKRLPTRHRFVRAKGIENRSRARPRAGRNPAYCADGYSVPVPTLAAADRGGRSQPGVLDVVVGPYPLTVLCSPTALPPVGRRRRGREPPRKRAIWATETRPTGLPTGYSGAVRGRKTGGFYSSLEPHLCFVSVPTTPFPTTAPTRPTGYTGRPFPVHGRSLLPIAPAAPTRPPSFQPPGARR